MPSFISRLHVRAVRAIDCRKDRIGAAGGSEPGSNILDAYAECLAGHVACGTAPAIRPQALKKRAPGINVPVCVVGSYQPTRVEVRLKIGDDSPARALRAFNLTGICHRTDRETHAAQRKNDNGRNLAESRDRAKCDGASGKCHHMDSLNALPGTSAVSKLYD